MDHKELYIGAGQAPIESPHTSRTTSSGADAQIRVIILENGGRACLISIPANTCEEDLPAIRSVVLAESGIPSEQVLFLWSASADHPSAAATAQALRTAVRAAVSSRQRGYLSFGCIDRRLADADSDDAALPAGRDAASAGDDAARQADEDVRGGPRPPVPYEQAVSVFRICDAKGRPLCGLIHTGTDLSLITPDRSGSFPVPGSAGFADSDFLSCDLPQIENPGIAVYGIDERIRVLRIGRTALAGFRHTIDIRTAADLQDRTMFLGTLTVQNMNGAAGILRPQVLAQLMDEAAQLLQTVQDGLHAMDPAVIKRYPNRITDIPYGDEDPSQKLDIWYPNERGDDPLPVVLMLHGGAFQNGDKFEDTTEPMLRGLERGYAVVSANYRLAPEHTYPISILDGKKALHYLRAHASQLGIDPNAIALWGYSSGAWLVSMIAVTAGNPLFSVGSEYSETVAAVIDWCGPCGNFLEMDPAFTASGTGPADHNDAHSPESLFMGASLPDIPEKCTEACPITYIDEQTPPVLIIHGDADPVVPLEQSLRFYDALKAAGRDVQIRIEPGKGHHGDYWYHETWLSDLCFDFLDQRLKSV